MSTATLSESARLLCGQIKQLKCVHRAGLTPSFGQVEELFDRADDLERLLGSAPAERTARACTRPTCAQDATTMVGTLPYCQRCGEAARALLKNLESFGVSAPVSVFWPAGASGDARVTGPDPRD